MSPINRVILKVVVFLGMLIVANSIWSSPEIWELEASEGGRTLSPLEKRSHKWAEIYLEANAIRQGSFQNNFYSLGFFSDKDKLRIQSRGDLSNFIQSLFANTSEDNEGNLEYFLSPIDISELDVPAVRNLVSSIVFPREFEDPKFASGEFSGDRQYVEEVTEAKGKMRRLKNFLSRFIKNPKFSDYQLLQGYNRSDFSKFRFLMLWNPKIGDWIFLGSGSFE